MLIVNIINGISARRATQLGAHFSLVAYTYSSFAPFTIGITEIEGGAATAICILSDAGYHTEGGHFFHVYVWHLFFCKVKTEIHIGT